MTSNELRDAARRKPFEPFRVIVSTGETYDIRHPDLIMVGNFSAIIGLTNTPTGTSYDRTLKVDLTHVVGIEELPALSNPSTNGPS